MTQRTTVCNIQEVGEIEKQNGFVSVHFKVKTQANNCIFINQD